MSQPGGPSGPTADVRVQADAVGVARAAADLFVETARQAVRDRGHFFVALSGGSTPRALYQLLAAAPFHDQVDWSRTSVFFGDERCVPPDNAESNYRMARDALLFHVPVPANQVFRMHGELADVDTAAALYEMDLRRGFALAPGTLPRFDLLLLGLGPDGHTASLFPQTAALHVTDRFVVANHVDKLNATRLTLTAPVINNAALVVFLVAGDDKTQALAAVLQGPRQPDDLPAQLIAPTHGALIWLVDAAAAAGLRPSV